METKRNDWFILAILIACFVPVVIDATVLHMAVPTLTFDLKASGTQVLWMIDIYSLIMAGLLLPMGVLGDKVGHKRMLLIGVIIFTLASLMAGSSQASSHLIASRILLAIGGAMIMPTTLAIIRQTFPNDKKRAIALGIWVVFANGGAAIGPIFGGLLIDSISWRAVFLVNIPLLVLIIPFIIKGLPLSKTNSSRKWVIKEALIILCAIIMLVYFLKNIFKADGNILLNIIIGLSGLSLLLIFVYIQKSSENPMLDKSLLRNKKVQLGMIFTFIPMVITSGFELLLSQELQLVHNINPLRTAMYITPFFIAFAAPGLLAGWFMRRLGIYSSKMFGLTMTMIAFIALGFCDFSNFSVLLILWLALGGFGLGTIMLAASYSIMSAASDKNAGTAGSLESVAYEMGVGLGVTLFGVLLSEVFSRTLNIPENLKNNIPKEVYYSINDALIIANEIGGTKGESIRDAASPAFVHAHSIALIGAGGLVALFIIYLFKNRQIFTSGKTLN